jgi:hypothetical protein
MLLCLILSFSSDCQPTISSVINGKPGIDLDFNSKDGINILSGQSWLYDDSWSLNCRYQSIVVDDLTVSGNSYQTKQGDFVSKY